MKIHCTPTLLDQIRPEVRQELIRQRESAMRGNLDRADAALRVLLTQQASSASDIDVVAVAMCRAELLYLDEQTDAAMEQFEVSIRPRLGRLDLSVRMTLEQNQIDIRIDSFGSDINGAVSDFYHLYDRKQAAAVDLGDYLNIESAFEAIEKKNHRKALSALWI